MYAPCPIQILRSKEKFVPRIFSPNNPSFFKELIHPFIASIDLGYSPLIYNTPSSPPMIYPHNTIPKITFNG